MRRRLPRYPATKGSIQGIGTPGKWSGSVSFNKSVTATSRVIPSCRSSIRSAMRGGSSISSTIEVGIRVATSNGIGITISSGDDREAGHGFVIREAWLRPGWVNRLRSSLA